MLHLYTNYSDNRVVSKNINLLESLNYVRKKRTSDFTPSISCVESANINNANYCFLDETGKYYFIVDKVRSNGGLVELTLTEDVLMTFISNINNLTAMVERQEFKRNIQLVDNKMIMQSNTNFFAKQVGNPVIADYNIFITTCGGGE